MKTLVNPNGTLVLNCTFEYGPTEAYGTTFPCNDPGFGEGPVSVRAEAAASLRTRLTTIGSPPPTKAARP